MKGLNKAYIIGHIGQDPELRTTANGKHVLKLSVATPGRKKVGEEWQDSPEWHRLTVFDQQAEFLSRYAHKGDGIAAECSLHPNKWTDRDGVTRYEVGIYLDRVLWLNGRSRGAPVRDDATEAVPMPPAPDLQVVVEEELPF